MIKKVLCWSDSATAGTGFGIVSKHVISALYATGKYDIDHLAINFHGDFVDRSIVPWQMQPAKLLDAKDPHGKKMFFRSLMKKEYDIVWILNDLYVTHEVVEVIDKIKENYTLQGKKPPIFIYYYPVDCSVQDDKSGMIDAVDIPVCYTKHGKLETIKSKPHIESKLVEIPHGVDTNVFRPLSKNEISVAKGTYFKKDPSTYVVVQVNRNSTRKQIPYSILAFKEFKKYVPNSIMYCHTQIVDQAGDLTDVMKDLGLSMQHDVLFPARYSAGTPFPDHVLNNLYNTGDMFLTTHLGEGWGLTITEAMAAGVPVVAPDNTCMSQQLGENSERGYLYPCNDHQWIDASGFRKKGIIKDIVASMMEVYNAGPKEQNLIAKSARDWAMEHSWEKVAQQWVDLFEKVVSERPSDNDLVVTQEV